jgi:hypothetical protein
MSDAQKENASPTPATRSTAEQALLAHLAGDHGDRAAGHVVVVEARVVVVHPADQPHGHVVVVDELHVPASRGVVLDEMRPALRLRGDVPRELGQLVLIQVARGWEGVRRGLSARSRSELRELAPLVAAAVVVLQSGRPNQRSDIPPPSSSSTRAPPANAAVTSRLTGLDDSRVPILE